MRKPRSVKRGPGRGGREEDQVAGGEIVGPHRFSRLELIGHRPRQRDAVLAEYVLSEPAAIEPRRVGAAVAVGRPAERQRRAGDRVGLGLER